jgi:hypothetical protein
MQSLLLDLHLSRLQFLACLLGRVDSFDPEPCCCDAQHREVSSGGFLVPGCDATELLETVDAALDKIASLVCFAIIFDFGFSVRAGRE